MAARAIHLHKNSLGNVFFHAIGDDICFGLGTINILRYDFPPFFLGGGGGWDVEEKEQSLKNQKVGSKNKNKWKVIT